MRCLQVMNSPDTITLDHRSKLLTQRVHIVMVAFFTNHIYFSETPNITWDDSFVPPELYNDLETELASVDAKKSQQVQKEKAGKIPRKKKKPKPTRKDKGKAKDTKTPKEKLDNPDVVEKPKRKRTQKTSVRSVIDITGDNEDDTPADKAEPPAKRIKRKKSIVDVGITLAPPPCRQCTSSQLLRKSIAELDDRSLIEDENVVDQLDDVPQQSKIKSKVPPMASKSVEEGSSESSTVCSRNFDLEHMQQQLKASQMELRIAQQQLQLANSRNEAQQNFYEAQRDLYEAQLADYRSQMHGGGSGKAEKAKEKA